jgi:hypothetical protein
VLDRLDSRQSFCSASGAMRLFDIKEMINFSTIVLFMPVCFEPLSLAQHSIREQLRHAVQTYGAALIYASGLRLEPRQTSRSALGRLSRGCRLQVPSLLIEVLQRSEIYLAGHAAPGTSRVRRRSACATACGPFHREHWTLLGCSTCGNINVFVKEFICQFVLRM